MIEQYEIEEIKEAVNMLSKERHKHNEENKEERTRIAKKLAEIVDREIERGTPYATILSAILDVYSSTLICILKDHKRKHNTTKEGLKRLALVWMISDSSLHYSYLCDFLDTTMEVDDYE